MVEAEVSVTVKHCRENMELVRRDYQVPELYVSLLSLEPSIYLSALWLVSKFGHSQYVWFLALSVKFLELIFVVIYLYIFHQNIFSRVHGPKISHRLPVLNATSKSLLLKLFCHALLVVVVSCLVGWFFFCLFWWYFFPCPMVFLQKIIALCLEQFKGECSKVSSPPLFQAILFHQEGETKYK